LPNAILRKLSDEEMAEYRRPFAEPGEGRRPTLTWPRQIPVEGEPADVHAIATEYADWLGTSNVPKLFLKAEPGAILANDTLVNLVRGWPALTEKTVAGIHFVQEDSPDEIGRAIAAWMGTSGLTQAMRGPQSRGVGIDWLGDRGGLSRGELVLRRLPHRGAARYDELRDQHLHHFAALIAGLAAHAHHAAVGTRARRRHLVDFAHDVERVARPR